jgi:hypothetical protein
MSGKLPPYPVDEESLLKVDLAHKALHKSVEAYRQELQEAMDRIERKHNPFIFTAQSVLYEAMANAAMSGFSETEMQQAMGCAGH